MKLPSKVCVCWHISSYSANDGAACVEAGLIVDTDEIAVRHSFHPEGPTIVYTRREWDAFIAGVKDGEFDFPD